MVNSSGPPIQLTFNLRCFEMTGRSIGSFDCSGNANFTFGACFYVSLVWRTGGMLIGVPDNSSATVRMTTA
jgi:hypothetical protein